ncbi:hypothetical protein BDW22DRAFT_586905 [Trametopsis cervina]|nr:hypothetical protein BDW22DRAFT_586905 [Trametopsis cervina]
MRPSDIIRRPHAPSIKYRQISLIPGLSPEEQFVLTRDVPKIASKYLDRTKPLSQQDAYALTEVVKECTSRFPFLQRYESSWPVEVRLRSYLKYTVQREKQLAQPHQRNESAAQESRDSLMPGPSHIVRRIVIRSRPTSTRRRLQTEQRGRI